MQRKNTSDLNGLKQLQNLQSQIQNGQDCITFISLSHYQMHKLVHDQQHFIIKVKDINNQAKKKIDIGAYKQALILLSEGQKILQYAAGSGKTIERQLIICVLHNIASAYHKLWMLQKCLSYVQGLIFNLENHLTSLQNSVMSSNQKQQILIAMQSLQMKHLLTTYSIRFCALNSQQYNHKQALLCAKKGIGYIKSIITFDEQLMRNLFKKQKESSYKIDTKYRLLIQIIQFQSNMNIKKHKDILKATHYSLQIYNKNKQKNQSINYSYLKNYSIGDFMDMKSKQYKIKGEKLTLQQQKQKQFQSSIIYKLLLLSISYFSISTEMRLNISQTQYYSQIQKQKDFNYKQSQIYHLLSIIIISAFIDFQILYLKHIINSYTNYFNHNLIQYKTVQTQTLEKVIELISQNQYKSPIPGSTQLISSSDLPSQNNQYKLINKFQEQNNNKNIRKNPKFKKKGDAIEHKSKNKNYSSLQNKSIIKQDKYKIKSNKIQNKQKNKTKSKSKSKTVQKKSKQKQINNYYFIKNNQYKIKKNNFLYQQLYNLSKKVSPKKSKELLNKNQPSSEIINKSHKKSIINTKILHHNNKKLLHQNKSPKKNNIYGLHF